ncbi:hypothetical protein [Ferdinandcohnia sp. Marseille-Q9671]
MEDRDTDRQKVNQSKEEQLVNQLDPELDLRNINFATGENEYLNKRYDDFTIEQ